MYQARKYREEMNRHRFRFFSSVYLESDLLAGVSHEAYHEEMARVCRKVQVRLHEMILSHTRTHPAFLSSLEPLALPAKDDKLLPKNENSALPEANDKFLSGRSDQIYHGDDSRILPGDDGGLIHVKGDEILIGDDEGFLPRELRTLYHCGMITGTGPMAAVAGLFARETGRILENEFQPEEIIIENGGDLYLKNRKEISISIHAGNSPLSDKIALVMPPGEWGICTSSGTLGHSFSRGRADALTVVAKDAALADAWATSLANRVQGEKDIDRVLDMSREHPEILSCVVILGEKMGIRGEFELKPIS